MQQPWWVAWLAILLGSSVLVVATILNPEQIQGPVAVEFGDTVRGEQQRQRGVQQSALWRAQPKQNGERELPKPSSAAGAGTPPLWTSNGESGEKATERNKLGGATVRIEAPLTVKQTSAFGDRGPGPPTAFRSGEVFNLTRDSPFNKVATGRGSASLQHVEARPSTEPQRLPQNHRRQRPWQPPSPLRQQHQEEEEEERPPASAASPRSDDSPSYEVVVGSLKPTEPEIRKSFFINMDKDVGRREHMKEELQRAGLLYQRVPGVNTTELIGTWKYDHLIPADDAQQLHATNSAEDERLRSKACDIAHRHVFDMVANQKGGDNDLFLVLEDDVVFDDDWRAKLKEAWGSLPVDWDYVRLGFWGKTDEKDMLASGSWYKAVRRKNGFYYYGSHAILLTPRRARKYLDIVRRHPSSFADDFNSFSDRVKSYVLASNVIKASPKYGSTRRDGIKPNPKQTWLLSHSA